MKLKSFLHPIRAFKNRRRYNFYKSDAFKELMHSDPKKALDIFWMVQMQYPMPWENPKTISEKIYWMEGMSDTSKWTEYSDKYIVRKHIEELGLKDILPKLYGVWEKAEDINFASLPNKFVMKCNHDCGSYIIVTDKKKLDETAARIKLQKCLKTKYGYKDCEPHYLRINPLIIAEELIENAPGGFESSSLIDYKFFCCNGKAQCCMVCYDRGTSTEAHDLYDIREWKRYENMSESYSRQSFKSLVPRPKNLDKMVEYAERIAKGFNFLRVDLYNVADEKIYFSEMTFTPHGGLLFCFNDKAQRELGDLVHLQK